MIMLTEVEFQHITARFRALNLPFAPDFKDNAVVSTWYNFLKHLTLEEMRTAYKAMAGRTWSRFPHISEIIDLAHGNPVGDEYTHMLTQKAWEQVMGLMRNTYEPKPIDEITARALKEILPSGNISNQEGWEDENIHWRRKEFGEAYKLSLDMHRSGLFKMSYELPRLMGSQSAVEVYRIPAQYRDYMPGMKPAADMDFLEMPKKVTRERGESPVMSPYPQKMSLPERFKHLIKDDKRA